MDIYPLNFGYLPSTPWKSTPNVFEISPQNLKSTSQPWKPTPEALEIFLQSLGHLPPKPRESTLKAMESYSRNCFDDLFLYFWR
jgi:hypothetical protein